MIDNTKNNMRILFYVSGEVNAMDYGTKLSRVQQDIIDNWKPGSGNLFSVTQIALRNDCSRGQAQKAIRQLEKQDIVKRRCGGYKTRWDAILCDECKREFEKVDIRYHVCSTFTWLGVWKPAPFKSKLINYRNRNWHYEGRICHDCITRVMKATWLCDLGVAIEFLGFNRKEE